jgi:ankyrin repeat protein
VSSWHRVERLIAAGADVNIADPNYTFTHDNTPLLKAAGHGHADVVARLLAAPGAGAYTRSLQSST